MCRKLKFFTAEKTRFEKNQPFNQPFLQSVSVVFAPRIQTYATELKEYGISILL
jgi:hypothetical protein